MNFDMNKMLQEAQRMQAELAKAQEEAASEVVEASAGGGMVTVKANGAGEVLSITIDPKAIDPDDPESLPTLLSDLERCRLEVIRAARRARRYQPEQVSTSAQGYTDLYRPIAEPADHEDETTA